MVFFILPAKFDKLAKKKYFKAFFQESYVIEKNSIISFFYVDDIVFAYKKGQKK